MVERYLLAKDMDSSVLNIHSGLHLLVTLTKIVFEMPGVGLCVLMSDPGEGVAPLPGSEFRLLL